MVKTIRFSFYDKLGKSLHRYCMNGMSLRKATELVGLKLKHTVTDVALLMFFNKC